MDDSPQEEKLELRCPSQTGCHLLQRRDKDREQMEIRGHYTDKPFEENHTLTDTMRNTDNIPYQYGHNWQGKNINTWEGAAITGALANCPGRRRWCSGGQFILLGEPHKKQTLCRGPSKHAHFNFVGSIFTCILKKQTVVFQENAPCVDMVFIVTIGKYEWETQFKVTSIRIVHRHQFYIHNWRQLYGKCLHRCENGMFWSSLSQYVRIWEAFQFTFPQQWLSKSIFQCIHQRWACIDN